MASNALVAGHLLNFILGRDPKDRAVLARALRKLKESLRDRLLK